MPDLETVRKRVGDRILEKGQTFREISLRLGRKEAYIQQYVRYGFPKRLKEMDRKRLCLLLDMDEKDLIDDELASGHDVPQPAVEGREARSSEREFLTINICSLKSHSADRPIIGRMALDYREFAPMFAGSPYNLTILRVDTDSMEPTFTSGSLVVCDEGTREYEGDGVYLIKEGEIVELKRLQYLHEGVYLVKSDNPRYQEVRCAEGDIKILARCISTFVPKRV